MNTYFIRTQSFVVPFVMLISMASAQDQATTPDKKDLGPKVNFVAVGDFPVSGAIIKNGLPVMVNPKPSELIPNPLYYKDGKESKSFSVNMNKPTASWARVKGTVMNILKKQGDESSNYLTVNLPDSMEDLTVFMVRDKASMDWRKTPRHIVLKNGIRSFPLGSMRIINFSSVTLRAAIGATRVTVPAQSVKIIPDPGSRGGNVIFPYAVSATIGGVNHKLTHTAVSFEKKARMNLVFYDRDGKSQIRIEGDDKPIKVVKYFELPFQTTAAPVKNPP